MTQLPEDKWLDSIYLDSPDEIIILVKKVQLMLREIREGHVKGHYRLVVDLCLEQVHTFHNGVK